MLLSEYRPVSELVTKCTQIARPKFPVIDFHMHMGPIGLGADYQSKYDLDDAVRMLKEQGIVGCVNPDICHGEELKEMMRFTEKYSDFFTTFGGIDVCRCDEPGFERYVKDTLREYRSMGVKGIKLWKNFGLSLRGKDGALLMPTQPVFDVLWQSAAENGLPVLFHIADPVAFFKPNNAHNERYEELIAHPDWSFCKEGLPSFAQLMQMQERLVAGNPATVFILAHCAGYAENLAYVSHLFDSYKNVYIDLAARIAELGRQPYAARRFLTQFSDRIVFGTDYSPGAENLYPVHYRFLETYDEYFPYDESYKQGRWNIYGVGLEDAALENIYYKTAQKLLAQSLGPIK